MDEPDAQQSLDEISPAGCWSLLTHHSVGRFAVAGPGLSPLVVPVNYVVVEGCIVFGSDPGTKLDLLRSQPASLQIDCIDPFHRSGWSVLVQGRASVVENELDDLDVAPWVGNRSHRVRLVPTSVTGRRIRLADFRRDSRGYL